MKLFILLAAFLIAAHLCHIGILWEGDTLPLAAAQQMLHGKTLYRDIWFDKPPLLPLFYIAADARAGWTMRLAGAFYGLLCCGVVYGFARDLWGRREGLWAAGLLGFFLIFDFPAAVIPVASDLLMLAPHVAAVWLAFRGRAFLAGVMAAVAFWISPKGVFVLAAAALWNLPGALWIAAGFAAASAIAAGMLAVTGALSAWWTEVWVWGGLYAASPFEAAPVRNGLVRTVNWLGFHIALVVAAARSGREILSYRWVGWTVLSLISLMAGLRFFPRYYFQLLPVLVLLAARGFILLSGRKRELIALLLLIPLFRFGPSYLTAIYDPHWRDTAMDRDSRDAAALTRRLAQPGDTLFVWGYRPELYVYTRLPAATMYLDSQPLTGVPADRHLTQSEPVETTEAAARRRQLAQSRPTFVLDGLSLYNPRLAISNYPELREWFAQYREIGRTGETIVYRLSP